MSDLVESGVDYCRVHHGIRNEDERVCDVVMRDPWDPELNCPTCEGHGYLVLPEDGEDEPCDDCEEGVTLCDLTPLLYAPSLSVGGKP